MTRRVVAGNFGSGVRDVRMSRPGYDALVANPLDRNQISFAASRAAGAHEAETGFVAGLNSKLLFSQVFAASPPVLFGVKLGGLVLMDYALTAPSLTGGTVNGTPWGLMVDPDGVMFVPLVGVVNLNPGEGAFFIAVEQG